MAGTRGLTSTQENYLEAISELTRTQGAARVRDLAEALSVHKSTVSAALKGLARKRLIHYAPYELTTLTPRGRRTAREIARRHQVIRRFLVDVLCVAPARADANACRMEHVMDRDVLRRLAKFAQLVRTDRGDAEPWGRAFRTLVRRNESGTRKKRGKRGGR